MQHNDVTISVICFSALENCQGLMGSLLNECSGARFILTANGNPAVSRYFNHLRAAFHGQHQIQVVHNQINQGFIAPQNMAFSLCVTPFFVMLNDDAMPPRDWLSMLKVPFTNPKAAIVGVKGTCQSLDERMFGRRGGNFEYVEASCCMVRSEFMSRPIFSDYLRFAYLDDVDMSLRAREKGYTIHQADFEIEHRRNTTSRHIPGMRHILEQNAATCRKRWHEYMKTRKFPSESVS